MDVLAAARRQSVGSPEGSGPRELSRGARGPAVRVLQEARRAYGEPPPRYGVDGRFGPETEGALRHFQRTHGLTATGRADAPTRARLGLEDHLAPGDGAPAHEPVRRPLPPSSRPHAPDAVALAQDGLLTAVMGVGFDEQGADLDASARARAGLAARGFVPLPLSKLDDAQLQSLGIPPGTVDRRFTYYTREVELAGRPVRALVQFVDRDTPGARDAFVHGMEHSEVVMYAGHARYGSGPDFDEKSSNRGNVVLGTPYDAHMRGQLAGEPNALRTMALPRGYQLMLFAGCRTRDYLDELRSLPHGKDRRNLDLLLSNDLLLWADMPATLMRTLDGLLAGEDATSLTSGLAETNRGVPFTADGFGEGGVPHS